MLAIMAAIFEMQDFNLNMKVLQYAAEELAFSPNILTVLGMAILGCDELGIEIFCVIHIEI